MVDITLETAGTDWNEVTMSGAVSVTNLIDEVMEFKDMSDCARYKTNFYSAMTDSAIRMDVIAEDTSGTLDMTTDKILLALQNDASAAWNAMSLVCTKTA